MLKWKLNVCAGLVLAAGCSLSASAQPDVIVGDLPDVSNYTTGGAVLGMRAYAVGTTSCNLGNQPLTWNDADPSNQYPVISQNIYRLQNGRFEQLGQAWLKHGFCALQGTVCSPCTPGGNCDALFPGCSDPYGSSLNGSQGGLGPKHVVNPATGFFPGTNAGSLIGTSTGDATLRARLYAPEADLALAGALYFVSSTYIQPEDVAAGNAANSASYRRVTISGTNYAMSLADTTKRQQPAIMAWQQYGGGSAGGGVADPSVILTPLDVASDGRFWIGSKAIDLGGGSYRYEYAVYNHNSNRGAHSFTVPLTGSTTTSLYYFHDVPYHSGEIQDGTDWGLTTSASSVAWNYANNQANDANENVIRWDTIYNFSFVANAAPTSGTVTLGLFGAGTASANVTAVVPGNGGGGGGAPFNDLCSNALSVNAGAYAYTNVNATTDGPAECTNSGDSQINADVWFRYTHASTCLDPLTISTCGSAYDTKLAVYQGATCPTTTSAIACNDDTTGCAGGAGAGLGSSVTFTPVANATYLIRVGGYTPSGGTTTTGTGTLTIAPGSCAPQAPANDACANAQWAAAGTTYTGSTSLATNDGTATCGSATTSPDVWYKYLPVTSGSVVLHTCGSDYDTVLSVHAACGSTSIACNDDIAACGLDSQITMNMTAGTTYYVRVAGFGGAVGNYSLLITGGGGVVPPSNDDCSGRAGYAGSVAFSTVGATTDGATTPCGQVFNEIWYNYPAQCTGTATLTAAGNAGFAPSVAVYDGGTCAATYMTCADAVGSTATATFAVTQGNSYAIRVGGNATGLTGTGTLTITCTPSGPVCDGIDFNNDGLFPDTADIDDFLSVFSGGSCSTNPVPGCNDIDFNNDGLFPDTTDIDSMLSVFSGGPCL